MRSIKGNTWDTSSEIGIDPDGEMRRQVLDLERVAVTWTLGCSLKTIFPTFHCHGHHRQHIHGIFKYRGSTV